MRTSPLSLLALVLVATGCVTARPTGGAAPDVAGPTWHLVSIGGEAPTGPEASITFDTDGRISGTTGCNRFFGAYDLAPGGALSLSQIGSTRMACEPGAMAQEQNVLDALNRVASADVRGDRLTLLDEDGTRLLTFEAHGTATRSALTGSVTYLPRIALPPDAVVTVDLLDVSLADAPSKRIARETIRGERLSVPVPFSLPYDRSMIDARHRYVVRAEIRDRAGALLWTTDTAYLVLTNGAPSSGVEVRVVQVSASGTEAGRLGGADGMAPQETGRDFSYTCESPDDPFTFRIRTGPGEIALWLPARFEGREGGTYRVLGQVRAASGAKYHDGPVTVWTKGPDEALLEVDGETFTGCRATP